MRFAILFAIRVRHDYYVDSVCRDLRFEPTPKTQRLIDSYRLRLRELADGIAVSAMTGTDAKSALAGLPRDQSFVFRLSVADPDFIRFTDLEDFAGKTDPVYTNVGLAAADGRALKLIDAAHSSAEKFTIPAATVKIKFTLAGNPLASSGDAQKPPLPADFAIEPAAAAKVIAYDAAAKSLTLQAAGAKQAVDVSVRYRAAPVRDRKLLALLELRYDKSMSELGKDDAPFEIRFKAKAGRWAYYVVTDQTGDFSVVDAGAAKPALAFSATNRTLLNKTPDDTDPVAKSLARQYPDLQRLRFLSDKPVPCSSAARKGIELRLGGQKIIASVPNPSVRRSAGLKQKVGNVLQDQNTFHEVVKYLKAR